MTITRTVNGTEMEFELNSQELYDAFREQEHKWDVSYVDANVGHLYNDEQVDAIAYEARRQMDKYDLSFDYALGEALYVLGLNDIEEEAS